MKPFRFLCITALALASAAIATPEGRACSRILYTGDSTLRIVGRSLDWKTPIPTNIYVYPRGMEKISSDQPNAISWKSKYGAVYAVGYDGGITEGMNEKGLAVNGLFCKGSQYTNSSNADWPPMSLAMFVAWILDQNATTDEAVEMLKTQKFALGGAHFDGGTVSLLHFGITDPTGRCAVVEFQGGEMNIYEGQDIKAMTNDPKWPDMLAIGNYWEKIGGMHMLPGTVTSPDRYVRGVFFDTHVEKTDDEALGMTIIRSIMANVSVPYTYRIEGEPNLSSTQWRSYSNLRDRKYYFDLVQNQGLYYIDLKECDLKEGAPVMKLVTSENTMTVGDATKLMKQSDPFTPMF